MVEVVWLLAVEFLFPGVFVPLAAQVPDCFALALVLAVQSPVDYYRSLPEFLLPPVMAVG